MGAYVIQRSHVKQWVVLHSKVTNPNKKYFSASVTISYDYNGEGDTIEKAYEALTDRIYKSKSIMYKICQIRSFKDIVKGN